MKGLVSFSFTAGTTLCIGPGNDFGQTGLATDILSTFKSPLLSYVKSKKHLKSRLQNGHTQTFRNHIRASRLPTDVLRNTFELLNRRIANIQGRKLPVDVIFSVDYHMELNGDVLNSCAII